MKSLGSHNTSPSEAIAIAVISWWAFEENNVLMGVEVLADKAGTHNFPSFHDKDVGKVLIEHSEYWEQFQTSLKANPGMLYVWNRSSLCHDKEFFCKQLAPDLGRALKQSLWWHKRIAEILKVKKDMKSVRKVMDS